MLNFHFLLSDYAHQLSDRDGIVYLPSGKLPILWSLVQAAFHSYFYDKN